MNVCLTNKTCVMSGPKRTDWEEKPKPVRKQLSKSQSIQSSTCVLSRLVVSNALQPHGL